MKMRRGTQEQILATKLYKNDFAVATDTNAVFVQTSDGVAMVGTATAGTHANRPTFGVAKRFYYETDTAALFLDTGEAWVNCSVSLAETASHAAQHLNGASDEIDADKLEITWDPTNSTPATVTDISTSVDDLTSHLKGIDTAIGGKAATIHNLVDGTNHPVTGLTENHVMKALTATTYGFGTVPASIISDFGEAVADAVGGMVTGNTESGGIAVTYQDDDNTLDFVFTLGSHAHSASAGEGGVLSNYQVDITSSTTLADLGVVFDPALNGVLNGITGASTLLQVLNAIDDHTH